MSTEIEQQLAKFRETLTELTALINEKINEGTDKPAKELDIFDTPVEKADIKTHMLELKKALVAQPAIADLLLPEELGAMVSAIRMQETEDLLAQQAPKTRKRATTSKVKITAEDMKNANIDELFGGL